MSQPTQRTTHEDKILSNIAIRYAPPNPWIWQDMFPIINTNGRESDKYYIFTKKDWFANDARKRAPGDDPPVSGFNISTDTFAQHEYVLAAKIPDRVVTNADSVIRNALRTSNTEFVTDQIQRSREIDLAAVVFITGVWSNDVTGGTDFTQWSDFDTSVPIDDVLDGVAYIRNRTGYKPNTLSIGVEVWDKLYRHPEILDLLGATQVQIADQAVLAQVLRIDRLLVGEAIYDTKAEGITATYGNCWGKNGLLMYVTPSPGLMVPTAGYTFQARPFRVRRWYDTPKETEFVEASIISGFKVTGTDLGYFFSGAVA